MKAHLAFSVSRRFFVVCARLLLFKQQRVAALEKQLEEFDLQKSRSLYFDSFQADANISRQKILKNFDEILRDYDKSYVQILLMSFGLDKTAVYKTSIKNKNSLNMKTFNELF